jgi:hypothetical protein
MVKKFSQRRVSSTKDEITALLECNGDLETHYIEFIETAGDFLSRLYENYGATLSSLEKQKVMTGVQTIFDPIRN